MDYFAILQRASPYLEDGQIKISVTKGELSREQMAFARQNKSQLCGLLMLALLEAVGLDGTLAPNENAETGWVIIPRGPAKTIPDVTYDIYRQYHDDAARMALAACQRLSIQPQEFHSKKHLPELKRIRNKAIKLVLE